MHSLPLLQSVALRACAVRSLSAQSWVCGALPLVNLAVSRLFLFFVSSFLPSTKLNLLAPALALPAENLQATALSLPPRRTPPATASSLSSETAGSAGLPACVRPTDPTLLLLLLPKCPSSPDAKGEK